MIIHKNGISFELNENDFTANIVSSPNAKGDILIQRSIQFQFHEYLITSIQKGSFKNNHCIYSIDFSKDSKLRLICEDAFSMSSIQSISIPSSLEELEEGWCKNTWNLNQIFLSPDNKIYKYLDNDHKIIVKKSNPEKNEYDVLVFGSRDIKRIFIPSTIKYISSYAFSDCYIQKVEFDKNTQLESIGKKAINLNQINNFLIPSTVKELKDGWYCNFFKKTEIFLSKNNQYFKYIEGNFIVGKSDPRNVDYDVIVYVNKNIKKAVIPSKIKIISSNSFMECRMLEKVEFSEDSKLVSIGKSAFQSSSIENITIPSHVQKIERNAFSFCLSLKSIEFKQDSELFSIEKKAFQSLNIKSFSIPKNLSELKEGWCAELRHVNEVFVSKENKNFDFLDEKRKIIVGKSDQKSDIFDVIVFACRDIENAFIPSSIKHICSYAFAYCKSLKTVTFSEDSQLKTIGESCFSDSSLTFIKIPSSLEKISHCSFYSCNLEKIEIPQNSQLKIISDYSFSCSHIKNLFFPSKLEKLEKFWLNEMNDLEFIEISNENKNFAYLENNEKKIIVGKSDLKSDVYDVIVVAFKNLNRAVIPSQIKYIKPYSFTFSKNLDSIEFSKSSELIEIDECAFEFCPIKEIKIPSNVTFIGSTAFSFCHNLKKIEFELNSKIEMLPGGLFEYSNIESFSIPEKVKDLKKFWCSTVTKLKNVFLSSENKNFSYLDKEKKIVIEKFDKKSDIFDVIVFANRNIKDAVIPHSIKYIRENAFSNCLINKISIPNSVKIIGNKAFAYCKSLEKVVFDGLFESLIIEDNAFYDSPIKDLFIPAKKIEIGPSSFFRNLLTSIELTADELNINCFSYCKKTVIVSFPNASKIWISSDSFFQVSNNFSLFIIPGTILNFD